MITKQLLLDNLPPLADGVLFDVIEHTTGDSKHLFIITMRKDKNIQALGYDDTSFSLEDEKKEYFDRFVKRMVNSYTNLGFFAPPPPSKEDQEGDVTDVH